MYRTFLSAGLFFCFCVLNALELNCSFDKPLPQGVSVAGTVQKIRGAASGNDPSDGGIFQKMRQRHLAVIRMQMGDHDEGNFCTYEFRCALEFSGVAFADRVAGIHHPESAASRGKEVGGGSEEKNKRMILFRRHFQIAE